MNYRIYRIDCEESLGEILIAHLADAGFDSFEQREGGIDAYTVTSKHDSAIQVIDELKSRYVFTYTVDTLADKNWNEYWESRFEPIRIDDRLRLRASFHAPDPTVERELVIDPRMAFGTGHHATTHLMCEMVLDYFANGRQRGARVLDYGCGTGVLAILARQLGAGGVVALDIEAAAVDNTRENASANAVELEAVIEGELVDLPSGNPYDLVLANINRNVLLDSAPALANHLRAGGTAFLSGILGHDERQIIERFTSRQFDHRRTLAREDWRAFEFIRK